MFRTTSASRKRKKPTRVVVHEESSDEEAEKAPVVLPIKKKKKKKRAAVTVMSFDVEPEEEESKKKKKKRKTPLGGGMGFGGGAPILEEEQEPNNDEGVNKTGESMYGKDALDKLKRAQKYKQVEKAEDDNHIATPTPPTEASENATQQPEALPSYLPLHSSKGSIAKGHDEDGEPVIVTGEAALNLLENKEKEVDDKTELPTTLDSNKKDAAWEEQVARRAGITPASNATPPTMTAQPTPPTGSCSSSIPTTAKTTTTQQLRRQVQSTVEQLQETQASLQSNRQRRQVEVEQTQQELDRHVNDLQQAGRALEYYQSLRAQLVAWVGALRELQTRLEPLQEALVELDSNKESSSWRQYQDDVISILQQSESCGQILGRQPPASDGLENVTTLDEFGRDVKSRHVLERDSRMRQRRQRQQNHRPVSNPKEQVFSFLQASKEEERQVQVRREALWEALQVALDELDDEYRDWKNLVKVFEEWKRTYPEEYQQCFANLSLADLVGIFVKVDLCGTHHPLHWQQETNESRLLFSWMKNLERMVDENEKDPESSLPFRVVEAIVVPFVNQILDNRACILLSTEQSKSLSHFYRALVVQHEHPTLANRIIEFLKRELTDIAIPILASNDAAQQRSKQDEDLREAMDYASKDQLLPLEKILTNLLTYWAMFDDLSEAVLDFISSKYLFLLSALDPARAKNSFQPIYTLLQKTNWLDRPNLFLQAAPIHAAATVYVPLPNKD